MLLVQIAITAAVLITAEAKNRCWRKPSLKTYPGVYQITEPVDFAETPTWDSRNNILYFVNVHAGGIYRYNYCTEELKHITLKGLVAPVIPSQHDKNLLIIGLNLEVVAVEWNGIDGPSEPRTLAKLSPQFPTSQVNDGKADPKGRLFIGTMGQRTIDGTLTPNQGVLYQLTCQNLNNPSVKEAPVNISNGMAFNKANNKVFYIDTPTGTVVSYDYDVGTGDMTNKKVVFDVSNYPDKIAGLPDGMTIDGNDHLWVALYGGGAVIQVNPATGKLMRVLPIPALDVTDVMWGGPNLDILFVTTSRYELNEQQRLQQPGAGAVYAVKGLNTRGLPMFNVNLISSINARACTARRVIDDPDRQAHFR